MKYFVVAGILALGACASTPDPSDPAVTLTVREAKGDGVLLAVNVVGRTGPLKLERREFDGEWKTLWDGMPPETEEFLDEQVEPLTLYGYRVCVGNLRSGEVTAETPGD